jgi:hypothetical protein
MFPNIIAKQIYSPVDIVNIDFLYAILSEIFDEVIHERKMGIRCNSFP